MDADEDRAASGEGQGEIELAEKFYDFLW